MKFLKDKKKEKEREISRQYFSDPSKIFKKISWLINICPKTFMAHVKTLQPLSPSFIPNVRSETKFFTKWHFSNYTYLSMPIKSVSSKLVFNIFDVKDQRWFGKTLEINLDINLIKYVLKIFFWRSYLLISKKRTTWKKP